MYRSTAPEVREKNVLKENEKKGKPSDVIRNKMQCKFVLVNRLFILFVIRSIYIIYCYILHIQSIGPIPI